MNSDTAIRAGASGALTRILHIARNKAGQAPMRDALARAGVIWFELADAEGADQGLRAAAAGTFDLILADALLFSGPGGEGLALAPLLGAAGEAAVVLVIEGFDDLAPAEAVRAGAEELIVRGSVTGRPLKNLLHSVIARGRIRRELRLAASRPKEPEVTDRISDPATGLVSEVYLRRRIAEELERSARHDSSFCLCRIDFVNFPRIAAEHGSDAVRVTLEIIARVLAHSVRRIDMGCHLGGGSFALVLIEATRGNVMPVIERIFASVATAPLPGGGASPLHAPRAGVVAYRKDYTDPDRILDLVRMTAERAVPGGAQKIVVLT